MTIIGSKSKVWVPKWTHGLGAAVWIAGPDLRLTYMNDRAEELVGATLDDSRNRYCHEVLRGRDVDGVALCGPMCPIARAIEQRRPCEPRMIEIASAKGRKRWVFLWTLADCPPERSDTWFVMCAYDASRLHRMAQYLERVASRSRREECGPAPLTVLTPRERQILGLLARDLDTYDIHPMLHISQSTVRNHVQHIIEKLEVHSVQEAVALYLTAGVENGVANGSME